MVSALGPLGSLNRRVTFQRAADLRDALNAPTTEGWTTLATVMARRDPVRDAERVAGAGVNREVTDRFTTHWSQALEGVRAGDQLLDSTGAAYRIVGRKELGYREGLEFSAAARPDLEASEPHVGDPAP